MQTQQVRTDTDGTYVGQGDHVYRMDYNWARLPSGWVLGDVGCVAVDSEDRVYVFNRGEHPMMVFDRAGTFLTSWGEGIFVRPHGVHIGPDDSIYCTDDGDHSVRKCTPEGKVLLTIGIPGQSAPRMGGLPFNRCTHTALSPENDIFVSDGYGNARVHKFSPEGSLLLSWGEPGTDPGQFNVAHNVCCDAAGWVYVADRENHRVQVFDTSGRYESQWNNLHRPMGLSMGPAPDDLCYVAEGGPTLSLNRDVPNLGCRVSILTKQGVTIARLGDPTAGTGPGQFTAPHGIAVDSRGDIYVAEVALTAWKSQTPDLSPPSDLRTFQKLVRTVHPQAG
jgi:DNA-binding beta-propeller fold protein YncE